MIQATTAPKPINNRLLILTYALALVIAAGVALGLMKFEEVGPVIGRVFGLEGLGAQVLLLFVASLHVYALPFLVRLVLSPLARAVSACCLLLTAVFWMVIALQLHPVSVLAILGAAVYMLWASGSYMILNGPTVLRVFVPKK